MTDKEMIKETVEDFGIKHEDVREDLIEKLEDDVETTKVVKEPKELTSEDLSEINDIRRHKDAIKKRNLRTKLQNGDIPVVGLNKEQDFTNPEKVINKVSKKQRKIKQALKDKRNLEERREAQEIIDEDLH